MIDRAGIGLAPRRLHDLAHKPTDSLGLFLHRSRLPRISSNQIVDDFFKGAGVGYLLQTLRRIASDKPPPAEAEALIRGLLERSLDSPNPAYRALAQAQWQAGCENFARVHQSATPAQRARAVQTLRGYEADFRVLAAQ